ncbi:MAG: exodeoxyribonuclease VII large subunit [Tannerella sp.]|jgi:exodeoxyribonuclease VII large subunit|nr:exodeoxyribonuclease VII large subunit [Tannerella sp.]
MKSYDDDLDFESDDNSSGRALTLLELNLLIRDAIEEALPETYWVRAETSDVRMIASSGHCYLEFIEKNEDTGQTVAKIRGTIWARTFILLKNDFEQSTGQAFASGLKVLVKVAVEFHELYGFSLNVLDIDSSYTLGDMLKQRKAVIRRLQEEGIFTLNKELPFPLLPQRIAVITSSTAAGYGDFVNQLADNKYGYVFYVKLFNAVMQGEKTEQSIIEALERIFAVAESFDVVVIIRGGGATSELNSLDSYLLTANCAQFPLPVITGIGHERDDTVLDMVAHTRLKTPTAVAAFLIECIDREHNQLLEWRQSIAETAVSRITKEKSELQLLAARFPDLVGNRVGLYRSQLQSISLMLTSLLPAMLSNRRKDIEIIEQYVKLASPDYILKRGYALVYRDGRIIKQSSGLTVGDEISIRFADGTKEGKII